MARSKYLTCEDTCVDEASVRIIFSDPVLSRMCMSPFWKSMGRRSRHEGRHTDTQHTTLTQMPTHVPALHSYSISISEPQSTASSSSSSSSFSTSSSSSAPPPSLYDQAFQDKQLNLKLDVLERLRDELEKVSVCSQSMCVWFVVCACRVVCLLS